MKPSSKMSAPSRGMKHSSCLSPSGDAGGAASPETGLGPPVRVTHSPGKWPSPEGPFLGPFQDQEETPVGVGELCPILMGRSRKGGPLCPGGGVQGRVFCPVSAVRCPLLGLRANLEADHRSHSLKQSHSRPRSSLGPLPLLSSPQPESPSSSHRSFGLFHSWWACGAGRCHVE